MISPDLLCTHLRKNNVLSLKCYIKSLSKDLTNIFTAVRTGFWMIMTPIFLEVALIKYGYLKKTSNGRIEINSFL